MKMNTRHKTKNRKVRDYPFLCFQFSVSRPKGGITLIELLVVVAIIGFISSAVFVSLSTAQQKGRNTKRTEVALQFTKALELLQNDQNGYPLPLDLSWICVGDYDETTCPFGSSSYSESPAFASALAKYLNPIPHIRAGEVLAVGSESYAPIITCKKSYGSICKGYDLRYQLEGKVECGGHTISESDSATFCQKLECPGKVVYDSVRGVYDCE